MSRPFRWLLLAALLPGAFACSTLSSLLPSRRVEEVPLRFAWPETFSARVDYTFTHEPVRGSLHQVRRRYTLRVEPREGGGRRLIPSGFEVEPPEQGPLMDPEPMVLFDAEGQVQGIEPAEPLLGEALLEALPIPPENWEEMNRVTSRLREKFERRERGKWERQVSYWSGRAVAAKGMRVKVKSSIFLEELGGGEVEAEQRITAEVGVPCWQGAAEGRCVRLVVETEPEAAAVERARRRYEEEAKAEGEPLRVRSSETRWRYELVTDPSTLMPHLSRMESIDTVETEEEGGPPVTAGHVKVEEYVFTYRMEPAEEGTLSL
jgi:hypothetical protein